MCEKCLLTLRRVISDWISPPCTSPHTSHSLAQNALPFSRSRSSEPPWAGSGMLSPFSPWVAEFMSCKIARCATPGLWAASPLVYTLQSKAKYRSYSTAEERETGHAVHQSLKKS